MHVVEDLITAFDQASDPRRVVAVEEHPEYPGTLVFQTLEGGLWPRYGEWMSRHLILNELFLLRPFVSLLEKDGWTVVFGPRSVPVLAALERWEAPLEIDGFTCPGGSALYPFQTFTLHRALERAMAPDPADRLTYVGWGTGAGKAQPLTEPVLTPQGWRTMGDLRVGDHVIGSDGKPTRVVGVYPQGIRPVFRVEMNDGTFARCDEEHLWNVHGGDAESKSKTLTTGDVRRSISSNWEVPAHPLVPPKTITGVVDEGVSEEQVCIMVDAPDNLYVTRGYNLTHNSLFATAGAQEMFNRDNVDVCLTFTLGPLRTNLYRTYLGTTELDVCVPEGAPAKRRRTYDERHQVYVLNYEKARVDFEALKALTAGRRTLYICDEAHKLLFDDKPNQARQRFDDLVFGSDATVWPLSASVVAANALRYRDVFNLAGRIHRNPLGTKRDFIQRYTHRVRQFYASGIQVSDYDWNLDMLHDVRHRVSDRAQSVRKTDPGIRELFKGLQTVVIPVQLSVEDARLYRMVVDHARRNTDDDNLMHYYRLLRYVCNNPAALMRTADPVGAELAETHPGLVTARHSAKLESFIDLVESIRDAGDKTLVFTQWVEMSLDLIAAALDKAGIRYVAHHGGRSRKDNQQAQEDFKADPDITVFLSSDAGAYGLNMTEARYVIHYEAPYSWDVMMQRSNRIDRADSHLDGLTAYVFVTDDSVEERVWRICNERRELASATLGTTEAMSYSGRDSTELGNLSYLIFGEDAPVREKKNSARRNRRTA